MLLTNYAADFIVTIWSYLFAYLIILDTFTPHHNMQGPEFYCIIINHLQKSLSLYCKIMTPTKYIFSFGNLSLKGNH